LKYPLFNFPFIRKLFYLTKKGTQFTIIVTVEEGEIKWAAEYSFSPFNEKFVGLEIVPENRTRHSSSTGMIRLATHCFTEIDSMHLA